MLALNYTVNNMRYRLIKAVSVAVIMSILSAVPSILHAQAEEPWNFLKDFTAVSGAVRPVKDGYVGAVLHNPGKGYFALVIYPGVCRGQRCAVENPLAFFVVDTHGILVQHHIEPDAKLDSTIGGFQIS